ncbi:MAG TPA: DegT/DnrJ/EryC1/StrS family aminotransferase [Candidatus Acidoferrales bacterium]|nr:DegT/DnrJ/EryC1/StrS family aminotransferase [Candidatus Acidoferrales bacterium]
MLNPHPTLRWSDVQFRRRVSWSAFETADSAVFPAYNARGALYQLLRAIPTGSVVLLPAFHCTALVEPVARSRFRAEFYRIRPDFSIDYDDLRAKLSPEVALVVVIHFFGFPADLGPILELKRRSHFLLLEDCAHSFLTHDNQEPIGHRGDCAIYSYYKAVPSLAGGALRINRRSLPFTSSSTAVSWRDSAVIAKRLAEQLLDNSGDSRFKRALRKLEDWRVSRKYRKQAAPASSQQAVSGFVDDPYLFREDLALARMPSLCKRILLSSDWRSIAAARRRNYRILNDSLRENSLLKKPFPALPENVTPWAYPVLLKNRTRYEQQLRSQGVPLFTFGEVLHPLLQRAEPHARQDAEALSGELMLLPVHQNLSEQHVSAYAGEINQFLAAHLVEAPENSEAAISAGSPALRRIPA